MWLPWVGLCWKHLELTTHATDSFSPTLTYLLTHSLRGIHSCPYTHKLSLRERDTHTHTHIHINTQCTHTGTHTHTPRDRHTQPGGDCLSYPGATVWRWKQQEDQSLFTSLGEEAHTSLTPGPGNMDNHFHRYHVTGMETLIKRQLVM